MSPWLAATIEGLARCEINNRQPPPCERAVPDPRAWGAAGICSLGSHAWRVMVPQFPLPPLSNESQVDFVRTNDPPPHDTPYQDLPPREGSLECGGWKWLIHQKSLSSGHADSISCCSEPPLPPEHVKRVPVIHGPMFLFSLKGPDSELLEKWGSSLELCHWKKWTIPTTFFLWQFSRSMEIQCTGSGPHRVMMRVIPVQFWARGLAENSTNAAATAAIVFVVAVWSWVPRQVKGFTFFFFPLQTPYTQLSMSWTQGWWGHGARKHQKA